MTQSFQKLSFNPDVIDVRRCMFEHSKVLLNMVFVMKLLHAHEQSVYILLITLMHLVFNVSGSSRIQGDVYKCFIFAV